jgi:hypothetical protein
MKNNFIKNLQFIFKPNYWLLSHSYSEKWDQELNKLLDENEFVLVPRRSDNDHFYAMLGGTKLWIKNHPFASFCDTDNPLGYYKRPSRKTLFRAYKKLKYDSMSPAQRRNFKLKQIIG